MKKIELLAPAGSMESLIAAIQAGCDAVYFAGEQYGARVFSQNFTNEEIIQAINYCHIYGVKAYITVNTIIYENEVEEFLKYIDFLHKNNIDAILIQDLGMFDLIHKTYPNLELHSSTQMHIHNLDGTKLMERIGMKRVVLARETSYEDIKYIKENSNIDLEVFVHGALCISYSGQCLMSQMIGGRSGNRGACAGSCRLKYDVLDKDGNRLNKGAYPLSTKDLNSLENIGKLIDIGVSSLKIEGRMKSPEYVYTVVSLYRQAIDSYYQDKKVTINEEKLNNLMKIFNRQFTKGFLFNANNEEIINGYRPNHMGKQIGVIKEYIRGIAKIQLSDIVEIGAGLRVIGKKHDVGIIVNDFYIGTRLVKMATPGDVISIKVNSDVEIGAPVVITQDKALNKTIQDIIDSKPRKILINAKFVAKKEKEISLTLTDGENEAFVKGNIPDKSINKSLTIETVKDKLSKLGDTVYKYDNLDIEIDDNLFVNIKELNELRRKAVEELDKKRLYEIPCIKEKYSIDLDNYPRTKLLTTYVDTEKNYKMLDRKYDIIYSDFESDNTIQKLPRVMHDYDNIDQEKKYLVGEVGALNVLKNIDTDFSFNVVNSYTVAFLHSIGVQKITLSYELNDDQIRGIIDNYHKRYNLHPNLEIITDANVEVMISKFSLNKQYNNDELYLSDMFKNRYKVITKNNLMYIYDYKRIKNYSKKYYDMGINSIRINNDI